MAKIPTIMPIKDVFNMTVACPYSDLVSLEVTVQPQWLDNNNHLNMGYYVVVFDDATTGIFREIGLDAAHRAANNITTFSLEAHVTYDREVLLDDPLKIYTRLLDYDEKRIHYMHFMYHAEQGYLAATNELMSLHVSEETRRAAPMHPEIQANLARVLDHHNSFPVPEKKGRSVGLHNKKAT